MRIHLAIAEGPVRDSFWPAERLARLAELGVVSLHAGSDTPDAERLARDLQDVEVVITGWGTAPFTPELLAAAPALRLIAHVCGSVGHLVSDAVYARGIAVISANRLFAESVAEGVIAYILAVQRRLCHYDRLVHTGGWRGDVDALGLLDRSVGLVGFGAVGRALTPLLRAFRCRVLAYDAYVSEDEIARYGAEATSLEALLEASDIVSLHLPRTPETYQLIDEAALARMRPGALLINTARGAVLDEQALADAVRAGRIRAVLDVFQTEPLPVDDPLRRLEDTLLIPHMAGPTIDRRPYCADAIMDDIARFQQGLPLRDAIDAAGASRMTR